MLKSGTVRRPENYTMALTTTMDMDKICRICLKSEPELYLIFEQKFALNNESLATILTELTMYKVNRSDELPHHMCGNCVELAKSAFIFKRTCEKAYRQLIGMLATDSCSLVHAASSSQIKVENEALLLEKSTQTDYSMYPCGRCEQNSFTSDALRMHRETEHKASAIVCCFCSKSFNRVDYLKTHIAGFHPESGNTSHNQCSICKRQFTRREHMRRHLAVIHKIEENGDASDLTNREDDSSKSTEASNELEHELQIVENHCGGKFELETDFQAIACISNSSANHASPPESDSERVADNCDVKQSLTDEEDEKPLSEFIRLPRKNFLEVLIDEGRSDEQLNSSSVDVPNNIKFEYEASPERGLDDESVAEQCKKATKLRAIDCSSSIGDDVHKEHKCTTCDKVFRRFSTLQRHMLNHKQKKSLTCKICAKSFTRTDFLRNHMNITHDAAKSIKCDECNTEFTHFTHYKRHRETKHTPKTHSCDICQKSFRTRLYMQRHMESHNKKRFVCKECSQRFLTKDELKTHIKSEGHDKPLLCPECGLRCKTSNILMVHMRRHKGEKPFKCKFCSKGFPRMDDLRIHERYHTGEKSHFCETCGKGFQRKYNLTIHMRVHTGEKPYKCEYCPHAFTQSNDLKAHIRRHTGERFRCEICGAPFLQGYQMRQHKLTEHGVKESPPTQRVEKYTSPEEQEQQIKQNLQRELAKSIPSTCGKSAETLESQESANASSSTNILGPSTNIQKDLSFLSL